MFHIRDIVEAYFYKSLKANDTHLCVPNLVAPDQTARSHTINHVLFDLINQLVFMDPPLEHQEVDDFLETKEMRDILEERFSFLKGMTEPRMDRLNMWLLDQQRRLGFENWIDVQGNQRIFIPPANGPEVTGEEPPFSPGPQITPS
ncbi:MAG: hypothetical protein L6Q57_05305 [Alphaproteobacteria bacterium]|nr:hypothetical protein [Alphaproteobacteria bacterium]